MRLALGLGLSRGTPTPPPGPDTVGLRCQLAADKGVTSSSGNVSAWADQSGTGNDFSQAGSNKPTIVANALNGLPVIRGDGSSQNITRTGFSLGGSGEFHIFMVAKERSNIIVSGLFLMQGANILSFSNDLSAGTLRVDLTGNNVMQNAGSVGNAFHRLSLVLRSNQTQELWVDGVSVATASYSGAGSSADSTANATLFGDGSSQLFSAEDYAEILVYNQDKTAQLASIESYLTSKWGV